MPASLRNNMPVGSLYSCKYTNRLMPACRTSLQHSLQGESVIYKVAPAALFAVRATFIIALASACNTYQCVSPALSSHSFEKPLGVPLNPSLIITLSRTSNAATFFLVQCDNLDHSRAMRMYAQSYRYCLVFVICGKFASFSSNCSRFRLLTFEE